MITRDNFTYVLDQISSSDILKAIEAHEEYVHLDVSCTNACSWVTLTSEAYDPSNEEEANGNGQLYCDFDQFASLVKESETTNAALIEWIES